jgi:hypothetical protein
MAIKYYLQQNLLSAKENAYAAHITTVDSQYSRDIIDRMGNRGTTISKVDMEAFLSLLTETICDELSKGYSVKLPFATIGLSVGGIFDGATDAFDKNRHQLRPTITAGPHLKKRVKDFTLQKISKPVSMPDPRQFHDLTTDERNSTITPNGLATIYGSKLKFTTPHPEQGIYFVSDDGAYEVKTEIIAGTTPSKLVFQVPDLPPGPSWFVEVRIAYGRNGSVIRIGVLPHPLRFSTGTRDNSGSQA